MKSAMKNIFQLFNWIELAIDSLLTTTFTSILWGSRQAKNSQREKDIFESSNFPPEMSFAVAFLHLPILILYVLPVINRPFLSFYSIFTYLLNYSFCKCSTWCYISFDTFKNFFFSWFLVVDKCCQCFLSFVFSVMGQICWNYRKEKLERIV